MEIPILREIVIIFALSIAVLFICHKIRLPAIVGFLLTGTLAGPHGLALVRAVHEVEILAEIGIVLLLFVIGMEFSLGQLIEIRKSVLLGGATQVGLTFLATFLIAFYLGLSSGEAIFIGFLIALSSTAIVLKVLQEKAEIDTPHGRTILGILIFQDIIIVPMMLFTPMLAGVSEGMNESMFMLFMKVMAIIVLVIVGARWIVPQLLYQAAKTNNREIFLLTIGAIGLAVAWLTSSFGLSLALGAFLAGLIISESEYSHQAMGNILPFRDVFISFFFVSIGMLLNVSILVEKIVLITLIAIILVLTKALIATFAAILLGLPLRTTLLVGLALSQVGEFSFILSKTGLEYGLLSGDIYQIFLSVSILTMALTPFIIAFTPKIADILLKLPFPNKLKLGFNPIKEKEDIRLKDHLLVIGYGINGRNLVKAASTASIPYLILEMNPETVRVEGEKGIPILYGDASQEAVLEHADIAEARVAVVAISDPVATRRITELCRRLNPTVYIIVRTRYISELKPLYDLGANEVIPEEFETSVEIFSRVLAKYLIPRDEIEEFVQEIRAHNYEMFRSLAKESGSFSGLKFKLPGIDIVTFRVLKGSFVENKTLSEIHLRREFGVTLLAIDRVGEMIYNPHGDKELKAEDLIIILGPHDNIAKVSKLFKSKG